MRGVQLLMASSCLRNAFAPKNTEILQDESRLKAETVIKCKFTNNTNIYKILKKKTMRIPL